MKLGKLSLVAVMALGTSAFAMEDIKVDGEAKLWYQTSEFSAASRTFGNSTTSDQDMFDNGSNSVALTALKLGASAKLLQNVTGAVKVTAISTLGLENNLVGTTPAARYSATGANSTVAGGINAGAANDQSWVEVLNLKYAQKEFDVAIGRMALQTPLAFTETWNVVDNTFEGAVAHAYILPDTVLAAAWVGKDNGSAAGNTTVNYDGGFSTFANSGAYAFGAINKSLPNTTAQAWYYNVDAVADAYWLQADTKLFGMLSLGGQFANMAPKAAGASDTSIFALKGAVDVAGVNLYAAFSSAGKGTTRNFSNVATGDKSMIYTALGSIYMDGEFTTRSDTDAFKVGASTKLIPGVDLAASYGESSTGTNNGTITDGLDDDRSAWDVVANTKVGALGLTAIYTQYSIDSTVDTKDLDIDSFRLIASLKF